MDKVRGVTELPVFPLPVVLFPGIRHPSREKALTRFK